MSSQVQAQDVDRKVQFQVNTAKLGPRMTIYLPRSWQRLFGIAPFCVVEPVSEGIGVRIAAPEEKADKRIWLQPGDGMRCLMLRRRQPDIERHYLVAIIDPGDEEVFDVVLELAADHSSA